MLYSMSRDKDLVFQQALTRYRDSIEVSYELYLFHMYQLLKITQYAQRDAAKRSAKHLPTEEDKKFTSILFDNELVQSLFKNEAFNQLIEQHKFEDRIDMDNIRKFYSDFSKGEAYRNYVHAENTPEDHKQILLQLYKACLASDLFSDLSEDAFANWIDDKSLVIGTIKKSLKALPATEEFFNAYRPTEETTKEFGEALISYVCKNDHELLELIEPTLKNWDVDRVAVMDMILLKMALTELLVFPTIPTKVTLNEFVEISKLYSTEKSKDFINGILDRLMKKLEKEGKINKQGRGLKG